MKRRSNVVLIANTRKMSLNGALDAAVREFARNPDCEIARKNLNDMLSAYKFIMDRTDRLNRALERTVMRLCDELAALREKSEHVCMCDNE